MPSRPLLTTCHLRDPPQAPGWWGAGSAYTQGPASPNQAEPIAFLCFWFL